MKTMLIVISIFATLFTTPNQVDTYQSVFLQPQIVEINATLQFNKCNNKAYILIDLPKNAKGWIYSISTINKRDIKFVKNHLLKQVQSLSIEHQSDQIADFITPCYNNNSFNLYIINGKHEVEPFYNCGSYKYIEKYIGTKDRVGYIKNSGKDTYYIGIENARDLKNLRLKIEAVAVL